MSIGTHAARRAGRTVRWWMLNLRVLAMLAVASAPLAAQDAQPSTLAAGRPAASAAKASPSVSAASSETYHACLDASDGTNPAWATCGGAYVARAEARLNAAWRRVNQTLTPDGKAALLDEQRAWLAYRDKSCQLYESREFGREGQILGFPTCRANLIDQRADDLESWADGVR